MTPHHPTSRSIYFHGNRKKKASRLFSLLTPLILLLLLPAHPTKAEIAKPIDSLNAECERLGDKAPFRLREQIITHYIWYDIDKADSLTQIGLALAREQQDKEGEMHLIHAAVRVLSGRGKRAEADSLSQEYAAMARQEEAPLHVFFALRQRAFALQNMGLHEKELENYPEMTAAAEATGDPSLLSTAYNMNGDCLRLLHRYDEAEEKLKKALEVVEATDLVRVLKVKRNIAKLSDTRDHTDRAIEQYLEAIALAEKIGQVRMLGMLHQDISRCYLRTDKVDLGIEHIEKSIPPNKEAKRWQSVAVSYGMLGQLYAKQGNPQKSLESLENALEIFERGGNANNRAFARMEIAKLHGGPLNNPEKAMSYFRESLAIYEGMNDSLNIAMVRIELGKFYYNRGEEQKALDEFSMALPMAELKQRWEYLADCYDYLAKIAARQNRYDHAYGYLAQQDSVDDLIMNREKMAKIEELTVQYQTAEKEKELLAQQQENDRLAGEKEVAELNYLLMAAGLSLAVLIGLFIAFRQRTLIRRKQTEKQLTEMKLANTRLERQRMESNLKEQISSSEQKALRAQMNPHFIFNTLNSIQLLIANNDQMLAMENVSKFAGLIRKILQNSGESRISLADEINTLELYLEMENVRLKDRLTFAIELDDQVQPEMIEVPPLVYQPFVENAIWHGIMNKPEKSGKVDIRFEQSEAGIRCTITDDGVGVTKGLELKKGKHQPGQESMGMKITEERLKLINGTEVPAIEIGEWQRPDGSVGGTRVTVLITTE